MAIYTEEVERSMKNIKQLICASLCLVSATLWADSPSSNTPATDNQGLITPYGQNPNIFHVFAYKTQESIISGVSRMSAATERGINKLKSKDHAEKTNIPITQQSLSENTSSPLSIAESNSSQNNTAVKTYALTD